MWVPSWCYSLFFLMTLLISICSRLLDLLLRRGSYGRWSLIRCVIKWGTILLLFFLFLVLRILQLLLRRSCDCWIRNLFNLQVSCLACLRMALLPWRLLANHRCLLLIWLGQNDLLLLIRWSCRGSRSLIEWFFFLLHAEVQSCVWAVRTELGGLRGKLLRWRLYARWKLLLLLVLVQGRRGSFVRTAAVW